MDFLLPTALLVAKLAIHEQTDDSRIGEEGAAVGMVGGQHDPPGVLDDQVPFEANGPLQACT